MREGEAPTQSIGAEQAVLGSLLISAAAWPIISGKLEAGDFYRTDHRIIFAAIDALYRGGNDVDVVTVSDRLERAGQLGEAGGLAYIGGLARDTPTASNVETYAAVVRERHTLRRLGAIGDNISRASRARSEQSAAELIAGYAEELHQLHASGRTGQGLIEARRLVAELTDDLDSRQTAPKGLAVGLADFDELSNGLEAGDLVVIAARPGVGKTTLMVTIASTVSETVGVAVFSAEMSSSQLMRRCIALHGEIPQGKLRRPQNLDDADWVRISDAAGTMGRRKLWIDDTASPVLSHIRAETLALKSRTPLGLVLVDYVQLVRAPGANRYEQLRDVAYGLKALAKELAVPIIVLAQLNRGVENREDKRPNISDLRDSGAIEEAADIVGLLYSEAYYDPTFSMPYVLECQIAKNRNGERGHCYWHFSGAQSHVTLLNPGAIAQYRRIISRPKTPQADL